MVLDYNLVEIEVEFYVLKLLSMLRVSLVPITLIGTSRMKIKD